MPSSWLDGPQLDLFGPPVVPANPLVVPEKAEGLPTTATSGPPSSGLSRSAILTQSLASKLQARLGMGGSMEYDETWKQKGTPWGVLYWEHTASGRPISASDCIGWPTPDTMNHRDGLVQRTLTIESLKEGHLRGASLHHVEAMSGWSSPRAQEPGTTSDGYGIGLQKLARMTQGWGTPNVIDAMPSKNLEVRQRKGGCTNLKDQVVGWATTNARDWKGAQGQFYKQGLQDLPGQAGMTTPSSPSETDASGVLNPALSLWLMGYPSDWLMVAPVKASRGTPSSEA